MCVICHLRFYFLSSSLVSYIRTLGFSCSTLSLSHLVHSYGFNYHLYDYEFHIYNYSFAVFPEHQNINVYWKP